MSVNGRETNDGPSRGRKAGRKKVVKRTVKKHHNHGINSVTKKAAPAASGNKWETSSGASRIKFGIQ